MCGRFAQFNPLDVLKARFDIENVTCDTTPSYNIAPSQEVLVLIDRLGIRMGKLKWGFPPFDSKTGKKPGLIINARCETLHEKRTFKESLKLRRCLILADGFYEWANDKGTRIPHFFYLPDRKPFAFAGLWDMIKTKDGGKTGAAVIITRKAEGVISRIHHRMPAIIPHDRIREWLLSSEKGDETFERLLQDHCVTDLEYHRVSDLVNKATFNDPRCMDRVI